MARTEDGRLLFRCGSCFHRMSVPLEQAGKRGQCARCGKLVRIPGKKKRRRSRAKRELIDLPQGSGVPEEQGKTGAEGESESKKPETPPESVAEEESGKKVKSPEMSGVADREESPEGAAPADPDSSEPDVRLERRETDGPRCAKCGKELEVDEQGRPRKCSCGSILTRK